MKTCGEFYAEAIDKFCGRDAQKLIETFAAGFIMGQAEKVFNRVCRAAMFRPMGIPRYQATLKLAVYAATAYDLSLAKDIGSAHEIWICWPEMLVYVDQLDAIEENSERWHRHRAWLCGIPEHCMDLQYHLRSGDTLCVTQPNMLIQEQVVLNAGLCLKWGCREKAGDSGYCEIHYISRVR